jgi:hypothetical protein
MDKSVAPFFFQPVLRGLNDEGCHFFLKKASSPESANKLHPGDCNEKHECFLPLCAQHEKALGCSVRTLVPGNGEIHVVIFFCQTRSTKGVPPFSEGTPRTVSRGFLDYRSVRSASAGITCFV